MRPYLCWTRTMARRLAEEVNQILLTHHVNHDSRVQSNARGSAAPANRTHVRPVPKCLELCVSVSVKTGSILVSARLTPARSSLNISFQGMHPSRITTSKPTL